MIVQILPESRDTMAAFRISVWSRGAGGIAPRANLRVAASRCHEDVVTDYLGERFRDPDGDAMFGLGSPRVARLRMSASVAQDVVLSDGSGVPHPPTPPRAMPWPHPRGQRCLWSPAHRSAWSHMPCRARAGRTRLRSPFAVDGDWQGRGLATKLLAHLADRAAQRGVDVFTAITLPANHRMTGVFRDSGFPVEVTARPASCTCGSRPR